MYSYYLLASFGPKIQPYLWWKRYLTQLQLVQFVMMVVHDAQVRYLTQLQLVQWRHNGGARCPGTLSHSTAAGAVRHNGGARCPGTLLQRLVLSMSGKRNN